jgi:hypothetical protein
MKFAEEEGDEKRRFAVLVDNQSERGGCILCTVEGPGALAWAKMDQSIGGSRWESADGSDFAYATPAYHPGLVQELIAEGYNIDASAFDKPEGEP